MADRALLLVDDDIALGELLTDYLKKFGYAVTAKTRPSAGLAALEQQTFNAAIFDVMLPEMDGFELCRIVRQTHPHLPLLMLTARGDLADRVVGLELGADDYLPKPFEPRELAARLAALLRRTAHHSSHSSGSAAAAVPPIADDLLVFDGIKIHLSVQRVWLTRLAEEKEVILTALEFRLLAELAQRSPAVVSRDYLIEKLRGFERDVFDRSVDITISRLRAKLGCQPHQPTFIKTIRGEGYAFIAARSPALA